MTPEEKITALVEHIKKEFPEGCKGVECDNCPLFESKIGEPMECDICEMLAMIESRTRFNEAIDSSKLHHR